MAMCVIAVVEVAPCQCFSPGGHHTTSPGRISSFGPPSLRTHPHPDVTIRVWPSGWVCQAVRAPGSKVTLTASTRAGLGALTSGSKRTVPVKYSAGPLAEGCEPFRLMSIILEFLHLKVTVVCFAVVLSLRRMFFRLRPVVATYLISVRRTTS